LWSDLLRDNAAGYARVAVTNIDREFPSDVRYLWTGPDDRPPRPRERNPVFYGSYDWHSCVEMHWLLVRLLRLAPGAVPVDGIRTVLTRQFTVDGLAAEARFMTDPATRGSGRPYGWGWALALGHELSTLDDPLAPGWFGAFTPLGDAITANFVEWLPKATYPVRHGVHPNSAFGLGRALPWARRLAAAGDPALYDAIVDAAHRWFAHDADYPGGWEPSGSDFLSPALVEAELMAQLLAPDEFAGWLDRFLPGLPDGEPAALFVPAVVSDSSDGQIAHLHGLNASRAWCWRRLAAVLPAGDQRRAVAEQAARRHADAALPHVTGDHYMVEHWLAAYAVLLLT
jgi:hypothetical protein